MCIACLTILWNKKVNLLFWCFAGYCCVQATRFHWLRSLSWNTIRRTKKQARKEWGDLKMFSNKWTARDNLWSFLFCCCFNGSDLPVVLLVVLNSFRKCCPKISLLICGLFVVKTHNNSLLLRQDFRFDHKTKCKASDKTLRQHFLTGIAYAMHLHLTLHAVFFSSVYWFFSIYSFL